MNINTLRFYFNCFLVKNDRFFTDATEPNFYNYVSEIYSKINTPLSISTNMGSLDQIFLLLGLYRQLFCRKKLKYSIEIRCSQRTISVKINVISRINLTIYCTISIKTVIHRINSVNKVLNLFL